MESPPAEAIAPAPNQDVGRSTARDAWRVAIIAALTMRVVAMLVAWAGAWLFANTNGSLTEGFFDIWRRWDARHFLDLAEHGYSSPMSDPHATEWWPGFPLLVRAVMLTGLSGIVAGLLINTVTSTVAFAYLYRTAEEDIGPGAGRRAVVMLAVFPTALFLIAPYSEGLFLAGGITAFYYARRQRWELVALPAAAAMSSRLPGAFILIGLAAEFLRQRVFTVKRIARVGVALAVGTIPFIGYSIFLWNARGDAFYYVIDAEEGWGRHFVGPIASFRNTFNLGDGMAPTNWLFAWRVELIASAAMVAIVIWAIRKREWGYAAFTGGLGFLLLSTTWYFSHPRMLLMFFPGILALTSLTQRRRALHEVLVLVMAPIATLGVLVYTRGAWFF